MTIEVLDTSHEPLPREVRVLVGARVVDRMGGFTLAFLPLLLVTAYDAPLRAAGLVGAAFGLATIPSRLIGGRLSDRLSRRTTIVLGLSGCAAAQLALATAPDLSLALLAAVVLGLCFEIYEPPSQALLADLTPPSQRVRAYAALGAAIAAAGVVAGLLAALLAGAGLRWMFAADAVSGLACAAVVRWWLPAGSHAGSAGPRRASPWRDARLRLMLAAGTGFATVYMTMTCGLPVALHRDGAGARWAGMLVALSAVVVIAARRPRLPRLPGAADPFGRMRWGYVLLAAGLASAGVLVSVAPSGWSYVAPVVVWSLGDAVLLGEPLAVVAGLADAADRGRYLAAYGVSWGVATAVAPALAAGLLATLGAAGLWGACAVASAALAVVQSPLRARVLRT
jgi:MFS family permease